MGRDLQRRGCCGGDPGSATASLVSIPDQWEEFSFEKHQQIVNLGWGILRGILGSFPAESTVGTNNNGLKEGEWILEIKEGSHTVVRSTKYYFEEGVAVDPVERDPIGWTETIIEDRWGVPKANSLKGEVSPAALRARGYEG